MAFQFTCGHCGVRSVGRVAKASAKVFSEINSRPYCFVMCDNCGRASLISFHLNSGWQHRFNGFENDEAVIPFEELPEREIFPERKLTVPSFLPAGLEGVYNDAEFNFQSERWKSAAQLYLQALEFACLLIKHEGNEERAEAESLEKKDLTKRINDLFEGGKIAKSLKEWAHQIRSIGQYHKHRYISCDESDCADLRSFVEMFLRYTFSIPGQIEDRRKRMKQEK